MTPYDFIINFLKENQITKVLDIGANTGEWAENIINNVPSIQVLSIEANPYCESSLKNKNLNYKICCLSNTVKNVNFYLIVY
jgi:precorrin-6B methylase 2